MTIQVDVAIIGAGPTGLCFAKSLAELDLNIVVIEDVYKRQVERSTALLLVKQNV